jgi:hypothetical protein
VFLPLTFSLTGGLSRATSKLLGRAFVHRGTSWDARWKYRNRLMHQVAEKLLRVATVNPFARHMQCVDG